MADDKTEKKGSSGGLLPIINMALLTLVLGIAGFNTWKIMTMEQTPAPQTTQAATEETVIPEAEDAPDAPPILIELDDFTVNLADTKESRFLRAKLKLEVRSAASQKKIELKKTEISDLIISILANKKFSEIRTSQGKFTLKEELRHRINRLTGGKPVRKVYFTDFVSQ